MTKNYETKIYEWTNNGKAFKLVAHYAAELVPYSRLYGPCEVQHFMDKSVVIYDAELVAYVDGERVDSIGSGYSWTVMDLSGHPGYKMINGLRVGFPAELGDEIQNFLNGVKAEGTPAEVVEFLAKEKAETDARIKAETVEMCNKVIAAYEAQEVKPATRKEARRIMDEFNNANNEGGEGFVPMVYSREDYDKAVQELAEIQ